MLLQEAAQQTCYSQSTMPAQLRVAAPSATTEKKQNKVMLSLKLDWQPTGAKRKKNSYESL